MADGARAAIAVFPPPPPAYDQRNEAAFRSDVSRWLQEVASYPATVAGIPTEIPAANLDFENIYPAAYKTLQDMRDVVQSAHFISGGVISAAAGGSIIGSDTFTDTGGTDLTSHTPDSGWASYQGFTGIFKIDDGTFNGTAARGATALNYFCWSNTDVITAGNPHTVAALITRSNEDTSGGGVGLMYRMNNNGRGGGEQNLRLYLVSNAAPNNDTVQVKLIQRLNGSEGETHTLATTLAWTKATKKRWIVYFTGNQVTVSYEDEDGSNAYSYSPVTLTTDYDDASHQYVGIYTDLSTVATNSYWYLHDFYVYSGEYQGEGTPPGINVTAGEGGLRATASDVSTLYFVEWAAATELDAPTIGNTKYVGIEYNAGAPQAVVADTYAWDFQTKFPLGQVYNNSGTLQVTQRELSRHFPKGVNIGTWLDVGTTLDVTGAVTFDSTLNVAGAGQFDTDVTIDGTLYLPTIGIVQYDQYHAITLDAGATASWVSGDSITLDIDGDNSGTGSFFKVRKNLTTDLFTVTETGTATLADSSPVLHVDGSSTAQLKLDGALGDVYLDLMPYSVSGRPYLRFNNNSTMVFESGPTAYSSDVYYHFTHEYASTRTQSAILRIVGAGGGGSSYLTPSLLLSHNGTDATITSDTGDLRLKSVHSNVWYIDGSTGSLIPTSGGGLGSSSEGIGAIYTTNGTKWYVVGDNYANFGLKYSGQGVWESGAGFRIKLDADSNSSTETFVVGHDAALTALFTVSESGEVDVHTGPLIIGTAPSGADGDELLQVGGAGYFEYTNSTSSGYDEGLTVVGTHDTASTNGPVNVGFYLDLTHSTGSVADAYGLDIGLNHKGAGTVTWATILEIWGGVDTGGGALTTLDMLYIISPYDVPGTSLGTVTALQIADVTAGNTANYAIQTGAGAVFFGDSVTMDANLNYVDPSGAIGDESYIAFTGGRATFGYYGSNAAARVYASAGKSIDFWTNGARAWYITTTDLKPNAGNTHNIGDSTYYVNDIYLQRVRANSYLYVYPYASGTGGGLLYLDGYAGTPTVYGRRSQGTYSSKSATTSFQTLLAVSGQGWDTSAWETGAAILFQSASATWSSTEHGGRIVFQTRDTGDPTTLTSRWQVLAGGDILPNSDDTYQLGNTSNRVKSLHVTDLKVTGDYAIVNPTSGSDSLPTNMTAGLLVRRDGGTAPAFNSAHVAGFISAGAAGTNAIVSIISGNTGSASLYFGDTDAYGSGAIYYDNNADEMLLRAGGVYVAALKGSRDFLLRDDSNSELATTATSGFVHIPSCNGTPTGTPTTYTGTVPMVYDRANNVLYVYSGGAWRAH